MFNVDHTPEFWTTVEVQTPVDDSHRTDTFRARFRVLDDEEAEEGVSLDATDAIKTHLRRILTGLDDIQDGQGKPLEFTPDLLERMLNKQHVRIALFRAYGRAVAKERAGN